MYKIGDKLYCIKEFTKYSKRIKIDKNEILVINFIYSSYLYNLKSDKYRFTITAEKFIEHFELISKRRKRLIEEII